MFQLTFGQFPLGNPLHNEEFASNAYLNHIISLKNKSTQVYPSFRNKALKT
jgi:hypothetical protein